MFMFPAGGDPNMFGATIARSVRFTTINNAYFSRAQSGTPTNLKKSTFSCWVKRTKVDATFKTIFVPFYSSATVYTWIAFVDASKLRVDMVNATAQLQLITTPIYRDTNQWYHVMVVIDTTQATAADRAKLYVNGAQVTELETATYPSLNYDVGMAGSDTLTGYIGGVFPGVGHYGDHWLAEIHNIDGLAYGPENFGRTCPQTGEWIPKTVSGLTYGTFGFYLDFSDGTSATTLGYDAAGSNDFTPVSVTRTTGFTDDWSTDSPTQNYCTFSYISSYYQNYHGGLRFQGDATSIWYSGHGSMAMPTGKWYAEFVVYTTGGTASWVPGLMPGHRLYYQSSYPGFHADSYGYYGGSGNKYNNGVGSAYGNTLAHGDVIGIAYDADAGKVWFSKNGTWQNSGDPAAGTGEAFSGIDASLQYVFALGCYGDTVYTAYSYASFGQLGFTYTPPTGFNALNARNIAKPTLRDASKYFDVKLYTGNGATQSITGLGFQPDLVWIKSRSNTRSYRMYDAVRGATKEIYSDDAAIEYTEANGVTAFNADGFSIGSALGVNANTETFVAWNFKESVTAGIDIVSYTGNGSNRAIAHSLGKVPACMFIKNRNGTNSWRVYHKYANATPADYPFYLDVDWAATSEATAFNSTAPTATEFTVGTHVGTNNSGDPYIAYLFTDVPGFSRFGKYIGNAVAEGPLVYCGFRPAFVMVKSVGVASWYVADSKRNGSNGDYFSLFPDLLNAETDSAGYEVDLVSSGFKIRGNNAQINGSGTQYVFLAFADSPFKYNRAR